MSANICNRIPDLPVPAGITTSTAAAGKGWWTAPPDMYATQDRYIVAPIQHMEGYWCVWTPGPPYLDPLSGQITREPLDLGHGGPWGSRWTNKDVALDIAYLLNKTRQRRLNDTEDDTSPASRRIRREV